MAGAPSKFTPEAMACCEHYLEHYQEIGQPIPTLSGLARYMSQNGHPITRTGLWQWRQKHPDFDDFAESLKDEARVRGWTLGFTDKDKQVMAKYFLANLGYSDKQSLEHSGPGGTPIKTESNVTWTIQPVKPVDQVDDESDA